MCNNNSLTYDQQDRICFLIGDWYINVKNNLINYESNTHCLGFQKEILKCMLCENLTYKEICEK